MKLCPNSSNSIQSNQVQPNQVQQSKKHTTTTTPIIISSKMGLFGRVGSPPFPLHHLLLLFLILSGYLITLSFSSSSSTTNTSTDDHHDLFNTWCKQHGKIYTSEEEKLHRFRIFQDNLDFVTQHNSMGNSTYTLDLNAFADLTHHEFKASRLGLTFSATRDVLRLKSNPPSSSSLVLRDDLPSSVDWRTKGAVSPVKDQGSCGACWAFSATGSMEGINQIVTGSLVSLSEQELVDCDRSYNSGCGGGLMDYSFEFVIKNKGIDTEEDYPFKVREGTCNKNKLSRHVVTIDGYVDIPPNDEKRLLHAVASQPVSVGICGSERSFQLYSKGIFSGPCSTSLDHAVLVVGYDSENGVDYWIVKNSWGPSWGTNGFMKMLRNGPSKEGVCGVNMLASYPTKTSPNPPNPPSPGPTKCSLLTHCGSGETCCCTWNFLGMCFKWGCCELDSAVCCKDNRSCCPQDYPVCDTQRNQCLKAVQGTRNTSMMNGIKRRGSSAKFGGWRSLMERAWNM